jgi:hypothetical protein
VISRTWLASYRVSAKGLCMRFPVARPELGSRASADVPGYGIGVGAGGAGEATMALDAWFDVGFGVGLGAACLPEQPHTTKPRTSAASLAERSPKDWIIGSWCQNARALSSIARRGRGDPHVPAPAPNPRSVLREVRADAL